MSSSSLVLRISPSMKSTRVWVKRSRRVSDSRQLLHRLSSTSTCWPALIRAKVVWEPMYPAPPVISVVFFPMIGRSGHKKTGQDGECGPCGPCGSCGSWVLAGCGMRERVHISVFLRSWPLAVSLLQRVTFEKRESNQSASAPFVRCLAQARHALAPVLLRGPAAIGHPWPCAANPASMPGCPLRRTCARPLEGAVRQHQKLQAS